MREDSRARMPLMQWLRRNMIISSSGSSVNLPLFSLIWNISLNMRQNLGFCLYFSSISPSIVCPPPLPPKKKFNSVSELKRKKSIIHTAFPQYPDWQLAYFFLTTQRYFKICLLEHLFFIIYDSLLPWPFWNQLLIIMVHSDLLWWVIWFFTLIVPKINRKFQSCRTKQTGCACCDPPQMWKWQAVRVPSSKRCAPFCSVYSALQIVVVVSGPVIFSAQMFMISEF